MTDSQPVIITADDVVSLNRAAILRTAAFARIAGSALVVMGAVGTVAWIWLAIRQQQAFNDAAAEPPDVSFGDRFDVSLAERLDAVAGSASLLLLAAITVGAGFGLRSFADYTVARSGGSLTGFEPGDQLDDADAAPAS